MEKQYTKVIKHIPKLISNKGKGHYYYCKCTSTKIETGEGGIEERFPYESNTHNLKDYEL